MHETNQPQPAPEDIGLDDLAGLDDPVAAVVVTELSSCFVQLCMCQTEPMVARLFRNEPTLRKPGGIELEKRSLAKKLYRMIDPKVFCLLSAAVPLSHAEFALSRIEVLLREKFSEIVGTAASYLLSDDRYTAIQMATVATTMAAREVSTGVAEIIAETRHTAEEV